MSQVPDNPKQPWFSCQLMWINAIQSVLSGLCTYAGLAGKHTNHALKATAATRIYEKGVDKQLIQERLGNSSEAVRSYKQTSTKQNVKISGILYSNESKRMKTEGQKVETVSKAMEKISPSTESVPSVVTSSANPMTVNYSYHGIDPNNAPLINVYPIINVPGSIANQPIVVNINIVLNK